MRSLLSILIVLSYFSCFAQQTVGVMINEHPSPGYTLFGNNEKTYLIDNCGLVVNSWLSEYKPGNSKYLLEDGSLLQGLRVDGPFAQEGGAGGRFELWSWEGELQWSYEYVDDKQQAHHDIALLPNGNFLILAWEKYSETEAKQKGRIYDGEVWSEKIVELQILDNNQAAIVWEWKLWDHLIQDVDPSKENYGVIAEHPERIDINYLGALVSNPRSWVHLNSIDYHPTLDQIVVSSRLFNELWIIDHSTTTTEAASTAGGNTNKGGGLLYRFGNPEAYDRGHLRAQDFFGQHDVRWAPEGYPHAGKLMVFNNEFTDNQSRVEIWSPPVQNDGTYLLEEEGIYGPESPDWAFTEPGFYSKLMSGAQMLSNGNVLICEGMSGRFIELNPTKETLWEYINPVNRNGSPVSQGGSPQFNQVFRATKYDVNYPAFEGVELEGSVPVEINPWENDCYTTSETVDEEIVIKVVNNPISETLIIESNKNGKVEARLFNALGALLFAFEINQGTNYITLPELTRGIYILDISEKFKPRKGIRLIK